MIRSRRIGKRSAWPPLPAALASLLVLSACSAEPRDPLMPAVDHHQHLLSAAAASLPDPGAEAGREEVDAEDLVRQMDADGVRQALVVSNAYYFDSVRQPRGAGVYARVRSENDWTAEQAARFPDRLIPFCSFNPLADHALPELERCARNRAFRGIKLHFQQSGVDLRNRVHLNRVRTVFSRINALRLPIIGHFQTVDPYGAEQAETLVRHVFTQAPDVPIIVAHLWGGGPFRADALAVLAAAASGDTPLLPNLHFELAQVGLVLEDSDGGGEIAAGHIRRIGLDRIFYGSDGPPGGMWRSFRQELPLTTDELRTISRNVAPFMSR